MRLRIVAGLLLLALDSCAGAPRAKPASKGNASVRELDPYLAEHPDDVEIRYKRAETIVRSQSQTTAVDPVALRTAIGDVEAWLKAHPEDPRALNTMAGAYHYLDDHDRVLDCLVRSYAVSPGETPPEFIQGLRLLRERKDLDAILAFQENLRRKDASAYAHFWCGVARLRLGDFQRAAESFSAYFKESPKEWAGHELRGRAWFAVGEVGRAVEDFDEKIKHLDDGSARLLRLEANIGRGAYTSFQEDLKHCLSHFPEDPRVPLCSGKDHMARSEWTEAVQDFDRSTQLGGAGAAAYYERAQCRLRLGEESLYAEDLDAFLRGHPDDSRALVERAGVARQRGDWAQACDLLSRAVSLQVPDSDVYLVRSDVLRKLNRLPEALRDIGRYVERNQDTIAPFLLAAEINLEMGKVEESLGACRTGLERRSQWPSAEVLLGVVLSAGDHEEALTVLKKALRVPSPEMIGYAFRMANLANRCKPDSRLLPKARELLTTMQTDAAHLWATERLYESGAGYEKALSEVDVFLREHPDAVQGHLIRGVVLEALGRSSDALTELQSLGETSSDSAFYNRSMGVTLRSLGREDEAREFLRKACALDPKDEESRWRLVRGYLAGEYYLEAIKPLRELSELRPNDPEPVLELIRAGEKLPNHEVQLLADCSRLLTLQPKNVDIRLRRATLSQRQGDYAAAIEDYRVAMFSIPRPEKPLFGKICYNRALCFYALKKFKEAVNAYDAARKEDPARYPPRDFSEANYRREQAEAAARREELERMSPLNAGKSGTGKAPLTRQKQVSICGRCDGKGYVVHDTPIQTYQTRTFYGSLSLYVTREGCTSCHGRGQFEN